MRYKLTKSVTFNEIEHDELLTWLRESGKFEYNIWSPFVRRLLEEYMHQEKRRDSKLPAANGNGHNSNGHGHAETRQVIAQALDERQLSLSDIRRTFESVLQSVPLVASEADVGTTPDDQDWFNRLDDSLVI